MKHYFSTVAFYLATAENWITVQEKAILRNMTYCFYWKKLILKVAYLKISIQLSVQVISMQDYKITFSGD